MFFVVLAPVLVLGLFQQRRATEQMREDNLTEVSERLEIALQLPAGETNAGSSAAVRPDAAAAGAAPPRVPGGVAGGSGCALLHPL